MGTFLSLFRAINVGGNAQVKMAALKELHEVLGFTNVTTYLQTGNVVFDSEETNPHQLAERIANEFEKRFGFRTEVMIRTQAELKETFHNNPFHNQPEKETKWIVAMFLSDAPDSQVVEGFLSSFSGVEKLFIAGKELYIYYPEGIGNSKLTNAVIEKKLKVTGTGRNWNTVTKLAEMMQR
ncbi:MAG: DUF1697 domain-containing protein [Chloroflexi bacterium]|uniref:DUF1697 domain-containing protein n=1 Tax=Candidatus Chlorohelix allophototropha TaxID=3003348 RepID=A0A8T7M802_9CHLR|nr:DUF1697 domain-containing protein [Chloroflexota bacterium]WJW68093.1 DUF1697 domain-containing protein [Chloroflexota bacterium L227-S17]